MNKDDLYSNKLYTSSLIAAVENEGISGDKQDESGSLSNG